MVPAVKIAKGALENIREIANSSDEEKCGVLLGKESNNVIEVREAFFTKNSAGSIKGKFCFIISRESMFEAVCEATKKKLDIVGVVHSHLGYGARPSSVDIGYMASSRSGRSGVWIVVDSVLKEIGCFIYVAGKVYKVEPEIVG